MRKVSTSRLWRAIRKHCLDCSCFQPKEVLHCPMKYCPLHDFRHGRQVGAE